MEWKDDSQSSNFISNQEDYPPRNFRRNYKNKYQDNLDNSNAQRNHNPETNYNFERNFAQRNYNSERNYNKSEQYNSYNQKSGRGQFQNYRGKRGNNSQYKRNYPETSSIDLNNNNRFFTNKQNTIPQSSKIQFNQPQNLEKAREENMKTSSLLQLPLDLLFQILDYLNPKELGSMRRVCHFFQELILNDRFASHLICFNHQVIDVSRLKKIKIQTF